MRNLFVGFLCGVLACALWGFIYLVPLLLQDYDPFSISMARFTAFGFGSLIFLGKYLHHIQKLTKRDWLDAFLLAFLGNTVYYAFLSYGIQLAGAPLSGMLMALIPLTVALITNRPTETNRVVIPWRKLWPPMLALVAGLIIGNADEFELVSRTSSGFNFWLGALSSSVAVGLWIWFPIRNGVWLKKHPSFSPLAWTVAQGIAILPVTAVCYLAYNLPAVLEGGNLFGETPWLFLGVTLIAGTICGWGGMALWNMMSSKLPMTLGGQLMVFETIFAVLYALVFRGEVPSIFLCIGMVLLISGVLSSLNIFRKAINQGNSGTAKP